MPPPRTGSVEPLKRANGKTYFRARIRLADGSRERIDVPDRYAAPAGGKSARERAEMYAEAVQEREDAGGHNGPLLVARRKREADAARKAELLSGETWERWFARYLAAKECGESYRRISGSVAAKWISPVVGPKPMASLTRDDVEDVRDKLDRALDAKQIRHATARNAWATFTGALKAACAARDRTLRVLAAPIHFGVLPPKRGASRQRPWLYPREWLAFAECGTVPVAFRQVCAMALYTGLRPGELRVLTWADVDLVARTISVSKALDAETGEAKPPKTARGTRSSSDRSTQARTTSRRRSGRTSLPRASIAPASPPTTRPRSRSTFGRCATRTQRGSPSPARRTRSSSGAWGTRARRRRTAT